LPVPGTIAAKIDLRARLRVFDFDGTLASASREAWTVARARNSRYLRGLLAAMAAVFRRRANLGAA